MLIREACLGDQSLIESLFRRELLREPNREYIYDCLNNHPTVVALEGEELLAFVYSSPFAPDVLEVSNLLVSEGYRSQGLGTRLLELLSVSARKEGFSALILVNSSSFGEVKGGFRDGSAFYRANGFSCIAKTKDSNIFFKELSGEERE